MHIKVVEFDLFNYMCRVKVNIYSLIHMLQHDPNLISNINLGLPILFYFLIRSTNLAQN